MFDFWQLSEIRREGVAIGEKTDTTKSAKYSQKTKRPIGDRNANIRKADNR